MTLAYLVRCDAEGCDRAAPLLLAVSESGPRRTERRLPDGWREFEHAHFCTYRHVAAYARARAAAHQEPS